VASISTALRPTGIDVVGDKPWGTHFCHFYEAGRDLLDTLVPYFKAGLENKEFCLWVISPPLTEEEARSALRQTVPELDRYLVERSIEILPNDVWYLEVGVFDLHRALNGWQEKLHEALARGYAGMRVTGDATRLQKRDRRAFCEYERELNDFAAKHPIIVLCAYQLAASRAAEVLDVARTHQFAVAIRNWNWEIVESPELKQAKEEIKRLGEELDQRVFERARELAATNEKLRQEIDEHKRAQEELAKREQQQAAIAELSQRALTAGNLCSLLNEAVTAIAETLGVEICSALELLPGGDAFLVKAGVGWAPGLVGSLKIPAGVSSPAGYTLLRNEPLAFGDLEHETRFEAPAELSSHGIVSGAVVTIAGRDRPFGALHALSTSRRVFTRDDLHFLRSVANIVATTIQRQAFEKDILEISEHEQRRIGQDLHDDLCQRLAGIALTCDLLQQSLAATSKAESAGAAKIARQLREAISHARMLARGLSPAAPGANGLMSGLAELASSVTELFQVSCRFECEPPVLVENDVAVTHLYRIAQEAISNAVTHGKSKNIVLKLSSRGGKTSLSIEDDGIGFPDNLEPGVGMGLRIMKSRADMIGAILDVRRKDPKGTIVTCEAETRP
jgi:signal transduction histidine kinase